MAFQQFSRKTCWKTCFFGVFGVGKHAGKKIPDLFSFISGKIGGNPLFCNCIFEGNKSTVLTHEISQPFQEPQVYIILPQVYISSDQLNMSPSKCELLILQVCECCCLTSQQHSAVEHLEIPKGQSI